MNIDGNEVLKNCNSVQQLDEAVQNAKKTTEGFSTSLKQNGDLAKTCAINLALLSASAKLISASFNGLGNIEVGMFGQLGAGMTSVSSGVNSVASSVGALGASFANIGNAVGNLISSLPAIGKAFFDMAVAMSGVLKHIAGLVIFLGFLKLLSMMSGSLAVVGDGLNSIASPLVALSTSFGSLIASAGSLVTILPALGLAIMAMATNMSGLVNHIGTLIIITLFLGALALMGSGLSSAGNGILNIGLGLMAMTAAITSLVAVLPVLVSNLAGITENVWGVILFVLLSAAMFIMAIALKKINENIVLFQESLGSIAETMSIGFVASFAVFALMIVLMSFFLEKVAKGIDKISNSMAGQISKLAILNPMLAAYAILSNPFLGIATVAAAAVGGLAIKALFPAMATGGVVSAPTVALVGEGRYPEAVVPLGSSPQFSSMKVDIANAVIKGMHFANMSSENKQSNQTVNLNIDGQTFAQLIMPKLQKESIRNGMKLAVKGV